MHRSFKDCRYLNKKAGSLTGLKQKILASFLVRLNSAYGETIGIDSKSCDIILDKVKSTPITPVSDSSMSEYPDNAYNIKTEIKQQQKHLSNKEISENMLVS